MAFDNLYPNRKDWRKPYYDSRRFDWSCRSTNPNHGGRGNCGYCRNGKTFFDRKKRRAADLDLKEYYMYLWCLTD